MTIFPEHLALRPVLLVGLPILSLLAGVTGCAEPLPGEVRLRGCKLPGEERVAGRCGTLRVWEDRKARAGRQLDLHFVVLPAEGDAVDPPLFVLHGGPGAAASTLGPAFADSPLRERRDIVLLDQRGTGRSHRLDCPLETPQEALDFVLLTEFPTADACRRALEAKADLRFYTTAVAMDDLEDLRAALGYERVDLWGGSYGTRAALVYLQRHGERIRAAVLDGVAPPGLLIPLSMPEGAQQALDALLDACVGRERCAAAFPTVREDLGALFARLRERPARARVRDPRDGRSYEVEITRDALASTVRYMLYDAHEAALLPVFVEAARGGDFEPFAQWATTWSAFLADYLSLGMSASVICSEDVPFYTAEEIARRTAGSFLGGAEIANMRESCEGWPRGPLPAGWPAPVRSEVPVLLLSGELDPATPPSWAREALRHLPNGRHVVLSNAGHFSTNHQCARNLADAFLAAGSAEGLDTTCAESMGRPLFALRPP